MTIDFEELKQKAALQSLMDERGDTREEVTTAFLVVQGTNGQWSAHSDFSDKDLNMSRAATLDDIVGGCANVQIGCQVQQTGLATVIMMEQRAMQMQQQMRQQQEANHVASLIDPKKLRV